MVKNKAQFLPEWIEFHLEQGVDRFVIYNNLKTADYSLANIQPYIDSGVVEWVAWPPNEHEGTVLSFIRQFKNSKQLELFYNDLYNDCLKSDHSGISY
jgi:Glycosyltransferase family 92